MYANSLDGDSRMVKELSCTTRKKGGGEPGFITTRQRRSRLWEQHPAERWLEHGIQNACGTHTNSAKSCHGATRYGNGELHRVGTRGRPDGQYNNNKDDKCTGRTVCGDSRGRRKSGQGTKMHPSQGHQPYDREATI